MPDSAVLLLSVTATIALLIGLAGFGWMRKQYRVVAWIDGAVALGVLLFSGRHLDAAIRYNETPMLLLLAFEASVVIVAALAAFGIRVPNWLIGLQAVINILLVGLLAVFLVSFKVNRLF
jgi:hypothetical protein